MFSSETFSSHHILNIPLAISTKKMEVVKPINPPKIPFLGVTLMSCCDCLRHPWRIRLWRYITAQLVMQWFPDLASSPDRKVCGYLANKVSDANAKEELRSLAKVPLVKGGRLHRMMGIPLWESVGRWNMPLRTVQINEEIVIVCILFNYHIMLCYDMMICDWVLRSLSFFFLHLPHVVWMASPPSKMVADIGRVVKGSTVNNTHPVILVNQS